MRIHVDIETYSEIDLKKVGVYKYAAHPSTDLTCVCWAEDDGPVNVWVPWKKVPEELLQQIQEVADTGARVYQGELVPQNLYHALASLDDAKIAAHNAQFERVVLNGVAGQRHGLPRIKIEDTICTMAKCAVHGLPESLEHAAKAIGTAKKRDVGVNDMRYFMKPRKGKKFAKSPRATPHSVPSKYLEMVKYCIDDVKAERDLDNALPELTAREQQIYYLDQRINQRGVRIDVENCENAIALVAQYKDRLNELCEEMTGLKMTQTASFADWIRENGYPQLKNLQAATIREVRQDPSCPQNIRALLKGYTTHNMKAVEKFGAMVRAAGDDGRLRGMMHYYGAGPGRWSSRIVQLQNMMRPVIKNVDAAIDAMWLQDMSEVRRVAPETDLMKILASCVRGMLIPADGKDLMAYDFAQIESRIQAWISGTEWKLKFFRSKSKYKVYHVTGAMMFGKTPEEIVDDGEQQLYTASKIGELACGYQGGAGAIEKFARDMDVELTVGPEAIKQLWRRANKQQVDTWYKLEDAAREAIRQPGKAYGIPNRLIQFKKIDRWLCMRLPSGRRLYYLHPECDDDGRITYMGINTQTRRWGRTDTYGGKIMQNACEGIGRDLLVNGMLTMEDAGYEAILSVHDEGVFEVPEGFGSDEEAMSLMTKELKWSEGLPVACGGYRAKRYRKD